MRVEMRVYRQFDLDLYALGASGYSLSQLLSTTVSSFANGRPVYILMDELNDFSLGGKTAYMHFCFIIDNRDTAAVNLLKSAAPRMRTSLCKMILRNALGQQDLRCFFPDFPEIDRLMAVDANKRLLMSRPDTIPISRFRVRTNVKDYAGIKVDMGMKDTGTKRNFNVPQNQYQQYNNGYAVPYQNGYQPQYMPQQGYMNNPPQQNNGYPYMQQAPRYSVPPQQNAGPVQNIPTAQPGLQQALPQQTQPQTPVQPSNPMPVTETRNNIQPVAQQDAAPQNQSQTASASVPQPQTVSVQQASPQPSQASQENVTETASAPGTVDDDLMNAFDNL